MSCGTTEAIVFGMGMLTGTGTTLTGKVMYGIDSVGLDGEVKKFEKPIFQTWLMFFAMVWALPIHGMYNWYVHREYRSRKRAGFAATRPAQVPLRTYLFLIIPSIFDLMATFLANIGLMYVTVSVFQLMKCTVIIFVALLKRFVLHDRLSIYMWAGIGINTFAVLVVGITSLGDAASQVNNSEAKPTLGIWMIVLSCLIQACQYVFEEKLMGESAPPLVVVGMEGLWGLLLSTFVVYPIAYYVPGQDLGSQERFDDAMMMLSNSPLACAVAALYVGVVLGYNVFAILTTYLLNSIWHAILDNFRPISVWGVDLLLFYVVTQQSFGEAWTNWSYLQLLGMMMLLVGTAVYNGSIRLPGLDYEYAELEQGDAKARIQQTSMLRKSPLVTRNAMKLAQEERRTPNARDRIQLRQEYLTEYHPEENHLHSVQVKYGSMIQDDDTQC